MKVFSHNSKNYISINGKDYFLLRGYQTGYSRFIFVQVFGNTSLNKEDLPGSDWNVIKSLQGKQRIWTAYAKRYFNYEQEGNDFKVGFLGVSTQGSYFLALRWLCHKFKHQINLDELSRVAQAYAENNKYNHHFNCLRDLGNSNVEMVVFECSCSLEEQDLQEILKGG